MSAHPKRTDPRRHALRTLASLLVRHGPTPPASEPTASATAPDAANEAEPVRRAA